MRLFLTMMLFSFMLSLPSSVEAKGSVKVGDVIPHDLSLLDQNRKKRSFDDLKGKKGLVLVFVRSAEWCPFCQKQILELDKSAARFKEKGYSIVTVSYDSVLSMQKFLTTNKPTITMLSDPRSDSIRAFGILNESGAIGTRSYGIPHPGVYIIDKNKKVQAKFFKDGYKNRASAQELLNKIDALNPKPRPKLRVLPPGNYKSLDEMGEDPILPGQDMIEVPDKLLEPVLPTIDTETPSDAGVSLSPEDYKGEAPAALVDDDLEAVTGAAIMPAEIDIMAPAALGE